MIHDTIKQRLRAALLLTPPPKSAQASALHHAASLQADGTWSDVPDPLTLSADLRLPAHLERTLLLAKAHRTAAGTLDDALRRAFDFWLAHDFAGPDWRTNQIVIPRLVGEIALLYDTGLSSGAGGKVMEILARSRWADWVSSAGWVDRAGMDLLGIAYNHLLRGCLENAPNFFEAAFARIFGEIRPVLPGEDGIQSDMTFSAPLNQSSGGGFAFMRECAQFIALAHGTPWQAPAETIKRFAGFLLDAQQWMMRQGTVDTAGSNDVFSEIRDLAGMAGAVQQLAQLGNPPRRLELAAFAHRLQGRGEALSGHRYFWRARMSIHQRPAFYASLRLDTPGPDGTGLPAVADGQTYLLRSGQEYHGLAASMTPDTWPGTTTFPSPVGSIGEDALDPNMAGPLAGGVSEGDYGVAVSELHRPGLSGKKAWFFFDESVVSLGTDLHGSLAAQSVRTTVNHCRLQGPVVARALQGETRVLSPGKEHALSGIRAVEHDGIHYVFPAPSAVFVRLAVDDAVPAGTFQLRIDHGLQPRNVSWACFALPAGDDPEAPARIAAEMDCLEVAANTPALQAVRHTGLNLLGVAFWEPGAVLLPGGGRVAANHACLLLCRDLPDGSTRLSIANLAATSATVHVEYGGKCVCFELPGGPEAGRSMSRLL